MSGNRKEYSNLSPLKGDLGNRHFTFYNEFFTKRFFCMWSDIYSVKRMIHAKLN